MILVTSIHKLQMKSSHVRHTYHPITEPGLHRAIEVFKIGSYK